MDTNGEMIKQLLCPLAVSSIFLYNSQYIDVLMYSIQIVCSIFLCGNGFDLCLRDLRLCFTYTIAEPARRVDFFFLSS